MHGFSPPRLPSPWTRCPQCTVRRGLSRGHPQLPKDPGPAGLARHLLATLGSQEMQLAGLKLTRRVTPGMC